MSLTAAERETTISLTDENDLARIFTSQRKVITRLRKNPAAVLVREGMFEGSAWAEFTLPAGLLSFRTTRVRREMTEEQRQAAAERFARYRAGQSGSTGDDDEEDEEDNEV